MRKALIELPEDIYLQAERYAARRHCSLADVCCQGLESLFQKDIVEDTVHSNESMEWHLPKPQNLGWYDLDDDELKRLARED